jgi:hypothetical protein
MFRRFFPPIVIGFVLFGVFVLGLCVKTNIMAIGCGVGIPKWYVNLPPIIQFLPIALCLPGILAAIAGPLLFGDSNAVFYFYLFLGQALTYWLVGHAVNAVFHAVTAVKSGSPPEDRTSGES